MLWLEEVKYVCELGEREERERERHLMEAIYHSCLVKISQCGSFGVPHSCKQPLACVLKLSPIYSLATNGELL